MADQDDLSLEYEQLMIYVSQILGDEVLGEEEGESEMIELQHQLPLVDDEELTQFINEVDQILGSGPYSNSLYYRGG